MQILKPKTRGVVKVIGHKPIRLNLREYFYHMREVVCGRNLKGIGQPRPVRPARFSLTMTLRATRVSNFCR